MTYGTKTPLSFNLQLFAKQTTDTPLTIGPDKAANVLGVNPGIVRQMLHSGELPGFKLGKRWLIPVKALEAWVDEQMKQVING